MGTTIPHVEVEAFTGPLDLLLYLVRQEEVEITEIPIARICDRFLEELERMRTLDLEVAGDFLVMASTLMLIKSRMLLPSEQPDEDEEWEDPRLELVEQLLEYRRIRETAGLLDEMRHRHALRHVREVPDPQELEVEASDEEIPLGEVSLGDLCAAFRRIMQEVSLRQPRTIVVDETPLHVHAAALLGRLREGRSVGFLEVLGGPGADRAVLIGSFLALLELIRQGHVAAEQSEPFGEIRIVLRSRGDAGAGPAAAHGELASLDGPAPAD
jgi:segregation and condensation protein A